MESTKNGKRNVNSNSRQRATLKRERSSAEKSPQIRRKSAPYVKLSATVATQTPSRIRRQKSVNIPPPSKKSAKSPQIRRQYTVDNSSYHHNSRRRKSSTKCIEGEIKLIIIFFKEKVKTKSIYFASHHMTGWSLHIIWHGTNTCNLLYSSFILIFHFTILMHRKLKNKNLYYSLLFKKAKIFLSFSWY